MRIGILGTGDVGRALGAGFATLGHRVMLGSRDADNPKIKEWIGKVGAQTSGGTFEQAATFAELAVLATAWAGTGNALRLAGPDNLAGKILIDGTNPLDFSTVPPTLALGHTDSGGEQVQRWAPSARVVKAFNIVGHAHMFRPDFSGGPPDMFFCGNDPEARHTVSRILNEFGWEAVDLGGLEQARYLEPLAMVWITHAIIAKSRDHAFKFLRK
jgi:8-hydroxy-5-deazaflavin:NADPH oxidoreductase